MYLNEDEAGVHETLQAFPKVTFEALDMLEARAIVSNVTVVEAVIVPILTPEYVPLKLHEADKAHDLVPSLLCGTDTVYVFSSFVFQVFVPSEMAGDEYVVLVPFIETFPLSLAPTYSE